MGRDLCSPEARALAAATGTRAGDPGRRLCGGVRSAEVLVPVAHVRACVKPRV